VEPIRSIFPHAIVNNTVYRPKLVEEIMKNEEALQKIEAIVHPLVIRNRKAFYEKCRNEGHFLVVYDIPLLFENRASYEVDYVIVVTASQETQRERVLRREGMTIEKFESILAKQVPDNEKRRQADFVIHTDFPSFAEAKAQLARIIETIISAHEGRWQQWKSRCDFMECTSSLSLSSSLLASSSSSSSSSTTTSTSTTTTTTTTTTTAKS
jgi:dephospho-CoA kinase